MRPSTCLPFALLLLPSIAGAQTATPAEPPPPPPPGAQPAPSPPPPAPAPYAPPPAPYGSPGYPPPAPYGPYPPPYAYGPYPAYGYPPPYAPPAEPREKRGSHLHDGFYLRLGVGAASFRANVTLPGPTMLLAAAPPSTTETVTGGAIAMNIGIGGTVGKGVVIGGEFYFADPTSPISTAGTNAIDSIDIGAMGPFVDWYFDPKAGFHAQASIGVGILEYHRPQDPDLSNTSGKDASLNGVAWQLGVGYEGFVSDEWSIGALLRLDGMSVKRSDVYGNANATALTPSLLFTSTYN